MSDVKKKKPWFKWYPSDWRGDPALKMVSRAAKSVWMDMLGLMHDSTLEGYLLLNGKKPTPEMLARVLGDDIRELSAWLDELADAGVYSETPDGVIYSRRMVRDVQRAEKGRADVTARGGAWAKTDENTERQPNTVPSTDPIRVPDGGANTYILEARSQKKKHTVGTGVPPAPTVRANEYPEEFEEGFWQPYPRNQNMSKSEALKAWLKLKAAGTLPEKAQMLRAVSGYRQYLADETRKRGNAAAVCHATTWLNQRRFDGYLESPGTPVGATVPTGPGWEAAYPETWGKLREELRAKHGSEVAWTNLFADCRPISETEIICASTFQRDTLQAKCGEEGEKLPKHIFKAPVQFRFERPTARH